jgi:hypothetical protein
MDGKHSWQQTDCGKGHESPIHIECEGIFELHLGFVFQEG